MTQRILLIEDDAELCATIGAYLAEHGFGVTTAGTLREGRAALEAGAPDLIVLDLQLPDGDGLTFTRELRTAGRRDIAIVVLTGRSEEIDRVLGLEIGADDYLAKPFSLRELLARIRAVLRRSAGPASPRERAGVVREAVPRIYRFAGWELRTGTRRLVDPEGHAVSLTNGEFALLVAFARAPRRILSRDQLIETSRMHDDIFDRAIDVQVLRLRRKLEADTRRPRIIKTERGQGYLFDVDVETLG